MHRTTVHPWVYSDAQAEIGPPPHADPNNGPFSHQPQVFPNQTIVTRGHSVHTVTFHTVSTQYLQFIQIQNLVHFTTLVLM